MATSGVKTSYDNTDPHKEDVYEILINIDPTDTPLQGMVSETSVDSVSPEWLTESLAAASDSNAVIEGAAAPTASNIDQTRVYNYTQISQKTYEISGTEQAIAKYGAANKNMGHQRAQKGMELMRDMELTLSGPQTHAAGVKGTTARELRGLECWYSTNADRATVGTAGVAGSTSADVTDGTQRAFTEKQLKDVLQSVWTNSGKAEIIMLGAFNRRKLSGFSGNANKTIDISNNRLETSVSVYISDWGEHKVIPNRFIRQRTVHIINPEYVQIGFLRRMQHYAVAKTGDSDKEQMLVEYTLRVGNEKAHGVVADLTTS